MGIVEEIVSPVAKGLELAIRKFFSLFLSLLFLGVIATAVASIVSFVGIIPALLFANSSNILIPIIAFAFVALGGILFFAISLVKLNIVNNLALDKKASVIEEITSNLGRNVIYVILMSILFGVLSVVFVILPAFVGVLIAKSLGRILALLGEIALLIVFFFLQFTHWEYVIGKKGFIESLKLSFAKVKSAIIPVFAVDVIASAIGLVILVIVELISFFVSTLLLAGTLVGVGILNKGDTASSLSALILGMIGGGVLWMVITIVLLGLGILLTTTFTEPIFYYLWKRRK